MSESWLQELEGFDRRRGHNRRKRGYEADRKGRAEPGGSFRADSHQVPRALAGQMARPGRH
jgi:hypothetical protein